MDIGLLHALELLTEVGATANPVCPGPDHLKEGKTKFSVDGLGPGWSRSDQPLQAGRGASRAACEVQAPDDMQLKDKALNGGMGGQGAGFVLSRLLSPAHHHFTRPLSL